MAEFDGIQERKEGKKKIPLGMAVLFIGLVVCALVYLYLFLPQTTGWTQADRYEKLIKTQEAALTEHGKADVHAESEHEQMVAAEQGKEVYAAECAACHGEKLEGVVGPALGGPKFKYGAALEDHIRVITKGTQKGMPGFGQRLGAAKIRNVASYIHTRHKH
ncbi:MAG: c-type cytochrome [Nitrospirota bacterium]